MKHANYAVKVITSVVVLFSIASYAFGGHADQVTVSQNALNAVSAPKVIVYITKTGEKYHRGTCQYLRLSKIEINLDDAIKRGFEPCSVCKPPT